MSSDSDNSGHEVQPSKDFSSASGSTTSPTSSSGIIGALRKRHIGIPLLGLILLAVIGYVVISRDGNRLPHASSEPDPLASDRTSIANFKVQSTDGDTFDLAQHKGKVVLVSFWSSECTTCVLELPAFSELLKRYKSDGLEVISINLDPKTNGAKVAGEVWARGKFPFRAYLDPAKDVAKILGIETVPSGVVIDRKGRMAFNSYGANDWLAPEAARLIEDLLLEE